MQTILDFYLGLYIQPWFQPTEPGYLMLSCAAWVHFLWAICFLVLRIADYAYQTDPERQQQKARAALFGLLAALVPFTFVLTGLGWLVWRVPRTVRSMGRFFAVAWSIQPRPTKLPKATLKK